MKKVVETITKYFHKGLYQKAHLEMLETKGIITKAEKEQIEQGQ